MREEGIIGDLSWASVVPHLVAGFITSIYIKTVRASQSWWCSEQIWLV